MKEDDLKYSHRDFLNIFLTKNAVDQCSPLILVGIAIEVAKRVDIIVS